MVATVLIISYVFFTDGDQGDAKCFFFREKQGRAFPVNNRYFDFPLDVVLKVIQPLDAVARLRVLTSRILRMPVFRRARSR